MLVEKPKTRVVGMADDETGTYLVKLARDAIAAYLKEKKIIKPDNPPKIATQKLGAFVTIQAYPKKTLRGCIGYPLPVKELGQAVAECAIAAAVGDPRFEPMRLYELETVTIEVSVLTKPALITTKKPEEYAKAIKIGRDGLLIEKDIYSGLLLPQVPVEWGWNEEEFLCHTCDKAGLPMECWRDKNTKVYSFQARIFTEKQPNGEITEKKLAKEK